jgi:hypothetical protein
MDDGCCADNGLQLPDRLLGPPWRAVRPLPGPFGPRVAQASTIARLSGICGSDVQSCSSPSRMQLLVFVAGTEGALDSRRRKVNSAQTVDRPEKCSLIEGWRRAMEQRHSTPAAMTPAAPGASSMTPGTLSTAPLRRNPRRTAYCLSCVMGPRIAGCAPGGGRGPASAASPAAVIRRPRRERNRSGRNWWVGQALWATWLCVAADPTPKLARASLDWWKPRLRPAGGVDQDVLGSTRSYVVQCTAPVYDRHRCLWPGRAGAGPTPSPSRVGGSFSDRVRPGAGQNL